MFLCCTCIWREYQFQLWVLSDVMQRRKWVCAREREWERYSPKLKWSAIETVIRPTTNLMDSIYPLFKFKFNVCIVKFVGLVPHRSMSSSPMLCIFFMHLVVFDFKLEILHMQSVLNICQYFRLGIKITPSDWFNAVHFTFTRTQS